MPVVGKLVPVKVIVSPPLTLPNLGLIEVSKGVRLAEYVTAAKDVTTGVESIIT